MQIYDPSNLQRQLNNLRTQKSANVNSILKKENAYESLVRFNQTIASARDSFDGVNSQKKNILQNIDYTRSNCQTAEAYINGMDSLTNGLGKKTVSGAYSTLLRRSKNKLTKYLTDIAELEADNERIDKEIQRLTRQIREIEEQLEQDGVVGG